MTVLCNVRKHFNRHTVEFQCFENTSLIKAAVFRTVVSFITVCQKNLSTPGCTVQLFDENTILF